MGNVISSRTQKGKEIIAKKERQKSRIKILLVGFIVFGICTAFFIIFLNILGLWRF